MKIFKVGDRVKVYDCTRGYTHIGIYRVSRLTEAGILEIIEEGIPLVGYAHPKQCRRLVARPARKERK